MKYQKEAETIWFWLKKKITTFIQLFLNQILRSQNSPIWTKSILYRRFGTSASIFPVRIPDLARDEKIDKWSLPNFCLKKVTFFPTESQSRVQSYSLAHPILWLSVLIRWLLQYLPAFWWPKISRFKNYFFSYSRKVDLQMRITIHIQNKHEWYFQRMKAL